MIFVKMAFLNIVKHPKRSLLITAVVAFAVVVMVLVGGLLDGLRGRFFNSMFQESGHVQVHAEGYRDRFDPLSLDDVIDRPDAALAEFRKDPAAVNVEKILVFGTRAIFKNRRLDIAGYGVDPAGTFFESARHGIVMGSFLPEGKGIALSERSASLLQCGLGDNVSLLVAWSDGTPYYLDFPMTGIFKTDSSDFDDSHVFISHARADELLALGGGTIEIRAALRDPNLAESFVARHKAFFRANGLEAETWREIFGTLVTLLQFFDVFMIFLNFIVLVVAATVITNTILMSVFERVRDFGTLRAVGLKRRHVFGMIMAEGALEGVLGSLFGTALAVPLGLLVQSTGINGGQFVESIHLGSSYPYVLSARVLLLSFFFGALIAAAGSLYAAAVNSRKRLVEMLRYN
ncbi:MAG: ABC transporter permease [Spirochaetales bacterium]|nr:ABC transporter permease [Spirochaetales bacterium]